MLSMYVGHLIMSRAGSTLESFFWGRFVESVLGAIRKGVSGVQSDVGTNVSSRRMESIF